MASSTREAGLWRWLKGARKVLRDDLHMQRVENSVGSGAPDVEGKLRGAGQFWIELKSTARPKRDGPVRFRVRDSQVEWMRRRAAAGGRTWLLLQVGSGRSAERYLVPGEHAKMVQNGATETTLMQVCEMRQYTGFSSRSPEDVVRRAAELFS